MSTKTSSHMRWLAENRTKDGYIRHLVDSPAWNAFDSLHPTFAQESRNVRLGLASDGINPFKNMSVSHSTWHHEFRKNRRHFDGTVKYGEAPQQLSGNMVMDELKDFTIKFGKQVKGNPKLSEVASDEEEHRRLLEDSKHAIVYRSIIKDMFPKASKCCPSSPRLMEQGWCSTGLTRDSLQKSYQTKRSIDERLKTRSLQSSIDHQGYLSPRHQSVVLLLRDRWSIGGAPPAWLGIVCPKPS
ncbi:hypothetical protein SASPL_152548 [Salvia splendens]|uniref:Uncharacterized protein n=1 Tax=Salvia splendens TaxID=180675 RepID=A0A8X8W440_SALSN|nr:hypothetical protein SASPL_152548 [Salvia splendens]